MFRSWVVDERSSACSLSPLFISANGSKYRSQPPPAVAPKLPKWHIFREVTLNIWYIYHWLSLFSPTTLFLFPSPPSFPFSSTQMDWCRPVFNLEIRRVGGLQDSNFPLRDRRALAANVKTLCCDVSTSGGPVTGPLRQHALLQSAAPSKGCWRLNLSVSRELCCSRQQELSPDSCCWPQKNLHKV